MAHAFSRTELLFGTEGLERLHHARVAVIGIGGVGSFAAEALARTGIGHLLLMDGDKVDITNLNRQIHATHATIGEWKVEAMKERIHTYAPNCEVETWNCRYTEETAEQLLAQPLDYIVDAFDTMTFKIHLIKACVERSIPIISSMGAANKIDPTMLQVADISKTSVDPIARVIRRELRKVGITKGVEVVFSTETPMEPHESVRAQLVDEGEVETCKQQFPPASNAFVPSTAGLTMASVVVRRLLNM